MLEKTWSLGSWWGPLGSGTRGADHWGIPEVWDYGSRSGAGASPESEVGLKP